MAEYYQFDDKEIQDALEAAASQYDDDPVAALQKSGDAALMDDGHLVTAGGCITVTVEDHKVCVKLPLGLGKRCLRLPTWVPNGAKAEACIYICTTWGIPTGVRLVIRVNGKVVLEKKFGRC